MELKEYKKENLLEIYEMFCDTVHTVNRAHYSAEQADAWAPTEMDPARWEEALSANECWVAWEDGRIIGFGDLAPGGILDRLYVHKDRQGRGVGSAILARLEETARQKSLIRICTEASITARPFFEKRGWRMVKEQQKPLRGLVFVNYIMEKDL